MLLLKVIDKFAKRKPMERNQLIQRAEKVLFMKTQSQTYGDVRRSFEDPKLLKKTKLQKLAPFVDKDGLLRSWTRLEYATFLTEEAKNPIILSGKNQLARLYINHVHAQIHHPLGKNALKGELMKRFLIQSYYIAENRIAKNCFTCTRKRATEAGLPDDFRRSRPNSKKIAGLWGQNRPYLIKFCKNSEIKIQGKIILLNKNSKFSCKAELGLDFQIMPNNCWKKPAGL